MAELGEAVKLVTDPANLTRMGRTGPQEQFAVNQSRVIKALREAGAGKAEARELALQALETVDGGAEIRASRGAQAVGGRGDAAAEHWWVPASAVRF
jgi:hypothetical protein